jgi:hypothetical protein
MGITTPRSGITYSALLESDLAAQWWGIGNPEAFDRLPVPTRARMIAAYRIDGQIKAVLAKEQVRKAERARRRKPAF